VQGFVNLYCAQRCDKPLRAAPNKRRRLLASCTGNRTEFLCNGGITKFVENNASRINPGFTKMCSLYKRKGHYKYM